MKVLFSALAFILFTLIFIKNLVILDPDFGWHVAIGEYILKNGFPKTDPFSYTMPGYPFINHEWLSDMFLYLLNSLHSSIPPFVFAFVIILSLLIVTQKDNRNILQVGLFLLAAFSIFEFSGVRMQIISWLFFACVIRIFLEEKLWQRWRYFLPVLTLIWANLHGGFAIFFAISGIFLASRLYARKIKVSDFFAILLAIAATLINPYGIVLWREIFVQAGDIATNWRIIEWLPGFFFLNFSFLLYLVISFALFLKYREKISLLKKIIYIFLLLLAISGIRHIPFFIIGSLLITGETIRLLLAELKSQERIRLGKVVRVAIFLTTIVFIFNVITTFIYSDIRKDRYPDKAISYLRQKRVEGNIFSSYDWGGYLIWKYPEKKVFIDGRMPSWKMEKKPGQSESAIDDYIGIILSKKDYRGIFEKYNINYVLVPQEKKVFKFNLVSAVTNTIVREENQENFIEKLEKDGWAIEYEDEAAVVYSRP